MQEQNNSQRARAALEKAICFYGRDSEGYYHFAKQQENLMMRYSVKDLANKNVLRSIALEKLWWEAFSAVEEHESKPPVTKMNWDAAAAWMIQTFDGSRKMYSDKNLRGLGAWQDETRFVVHLGNKVIVVSESENNLQPIKIEQLETNYSYMRLSNPIELTDKNILSLEEAHQIIKAFQLFPWERPDLDPILLAGSTFLMPIAGALDWRPHIWINGLAGTGKSTLWKLIKLILNVFSLGFQSPKTTEAAIRQSIKINAIPILFDEAEGRSREEKLNIQNIINLARASSTESEAPIAKGTAAQQVINFDIRSMWIMSSIANSLEEEQDLERFTVLRLKKQAQDIKQYHQQIVPLFAFFNKDFSSRFFNRAVFSIIKIKRCIPVLSKALIGRLENSSRPLQHYSTLLAGYWMLTNEHVITEEEAMILINKFEFFKPKEKINDSNFNLPSRLISHLLTSQIDVQSSESSLRRRLTIGEIIATLMEAGAPGFASPIQDEEKALQRYGISFCKNEGLAIRNSHKELERIFSEINYPKDWNAVFKQLDGVKTSKKGFAGSGGQRCVVIPTEVYQKLIEDCSENSEEDPLEEF